MKFLGFIAVFLNIAFNVAFAENTSTQEPSQSLTLTKQSLVMAITDGHLEEVRELLDRKSMIVHHLDNYDDVWGTPLHYAVKNGRIEIVKMLVEKYGADINAQYEYEYKRTNAPNTFDYTPLHLAIANGRKDIVTYLLNKGADPNIATSFRMGRTPLHLASRLRQKEMVTQLISAGADVNAIGYDKKTPLHLAIAVNRMTFLIVYFANWKISAMDPLGVVDELLKAGAYVNAQDEYHNTPLHYAAETVSIEIVNRLLEEPDIDVDIQNNSGNMAYCYAKYAGNDRKPVLQILSKHYSHYSKLCWW